MKKSQQQQQACRPPAKPINQSNDQSALYRNINAVQRGLPDKRQRGGLQARIAHNRQDQYAARGPESE